MADWIRIWLRVWVILIVREIKELKLESDGSIDMGFPPISKPKSWVNENEIECDEKEKINLSSPCKPFAVTFKVSYIDSPHK